MTATPAPRRARQAPLRVLSLTLLGLLTCEARADEAPPPAPPAPPTPVVASEPAPPAAPPVPLTRAGVEHALQRGVAYLVAAQNRDGSWGSPASNLWDIYAPAPGSQQAFQVASSALAVIGLLEAGGETPAVKQAVGRGAAWLAKNHAVGRPTADVIYNTWAHAYALEAFALLLTRETDAERRAQLRAAAEVAVDRLDRFQFAEGGWGYYNFDERTRRPGPGSTSFSTATCLVALGLARDQGVKVPARLIPRALTDLDACAYPDGSFAYGYYIHLRPRMGVNQLKGSLARTPACLLAYRAWGREVPEARRAKALDDLHTHGHFLLIARKYPFPHETWYQNSGYFCFYGYYYAAELARTLPSPARERHLSSIAARLVPLQEKDGSWWDYQIFSFHKAYGTGYVLSALARARHGLPPAPPEPPVGAPAAPPAAPGAR